MNKNNLNEFIRGWFVGDFEPSLLKSKEVEVAVKKYVAGQMEDKHIHKIATEITVIISGEVEMNGIRYVADDVITIEPYEKTDFKCITDAITVVVKMPCISGDKYVE